MNLLKTYKNGSKIMIAIPVESRIFFYNAAKKIESNIPFDDRDEWFPVVMRLLKEDIAPIALGGKGKDVTNKQMNVISMITEKADIGDFEKVYKSRRTNLRMSKKELERHKYWRDIENRQL